MYIDAHCHLDLLEKEGLKVNEVIRRGMKKGVDVIIVNGVNPNSNAFVLKAAKLHNSIKPCLGIYPTDALPLPMLEIENEIVFIKQHAREIVGIGEVGLDFKEDTTKHAKQIKVFTLFIKLANELDLPITVHSRKAELYCIEILEKLDAKKVMMHYFSGKLKLVERIVKNGWYLSIPTCVVYSEHFQYIAKNAPLSRLLCETDSPYSHPFKEFPNEPANVVESYKKISEVKGLPLAKVTEQITLNAKRLFGSITL